MVGCGVYHWIWTVGIPKLRGYEIRQEILELDDGAQSQTLIKVPVAELEAWDASHDHSGRRLVSNVPETSFTGKGEDTDSSKGRAK